MLRKYKEAFSQSMSVFIVCKKCPRKHVTEEEHIIILWKNTMLYQTIFTFLRPKYIKIYNWHNTDFYLWGEWKGKSRVYLSDELAHARLIFNTNTKVYIFVSKTSCVTFMRYQIYDDFETQWLDSWTMNKYIKCSKVFLKINFLVN